MEVTHPFGTIMRSMKPVCGGHEEGSQEQKEGSLGSVETESEKLTSNLPVSTSSY